MRHVFGRSNVERRHREKFFSRVAIVINSNVVNRDERQRLFVTDIHRAWIRIEQQSIFVVLLFQRCFSFASLGYITNVAANCLALALWLTLDRENALKDPI